MTTHNIDTLGMKCPQPVLKIAVMARKVESGDMLEVIADCPSFPGDIAAWCDKTGNVLLVCSDEGDGVSKAQIQIM